MTTNRLEEQQVQPGQPMPRATVTVLIPAYNAASFLQETLQSVFAQTRAADEVLVVDDGSSDETAQVVRSFGDRVRYIYQENQGIAGARNTGIAAATGDYVALFDHDDLMLPDKLEKQMALVDERPELVMVYSGFTYLFDNGSTREVPAFPAGDLRAILRYRNPVLPSTTVLRRSAIAEAGGFRDYFGIDDWDIWSRLTQRHPAAAFQGVDAPLTLYRFHEHNTTSRNYLRMGAAVLRLSEAQLLADLSRWRRWLWMRRVRARVYYHTALKLRDLHDDASWQYALESFLQWPFPTRTITSHKYAVFAHMLLTRLRRSPWTLRGLWPVRSCRQELEDNL